MMGRNTTPTKEQTRLAMANPLFDDFIVGLSLPGAGGGDVSRGAFEVAYVES
jgi:hypothetical protein